VETTNSSLFRFMAWINQRAAIITAPNSWGPLITRLRQLIKASNPKNRLRTHLQKRSPLSWFENNTKFRGRYLHRKFLPIRVPWRERTWTPIITAFLGPNSSILKLVRRERNSLQTLSSCRNLFISTNKVWTTSK
jgi:hypothetical protein